jgi:hypothetical protein
VGRTRVFIDARAARTASPAPEAQYGGDLFETASRYLAGVASNSGRARFRHAIRPRGFTASVRLVATLEHLTVSPTDSLSGRAIRAHLEERRYGVPKNRVAQGVLIVPRSRQVYLRRRRKQAVRTNLHRAQEERLTGAHLSSLPERKAFTDLIQSELGDPWWERKLLIDRPEAEWWAVFEAENQPAGLAVVSVDSEVALIWSLLCRSHRARWLLHTEIGTELANRGGPCLLVVTRMAPVLDPGLQYFQRRLGYQVAHLKLR